MISLMNIFILPKLGHCHRSQAFSSTALTNLPAERSFVSLQKTLIQLFCCALSS